MRLYLSRIEQSVLVVLVLAILGAFFVLSYAYGRRQRESADMPFLEAASIPDVMPSASPAPKAPTDEIVVHVTGAVQCPGVYHFRKQERVDDAIRKAGGARKDGYPDGLNLAACLEDGERISVPTREEWRQLTATAPPPLVVAGAADPLHAEPTKGAVKPQAAPAPKNAPVPADTGPKPLPAKKVHLNTGTTDDLMTLPGIGPVSAQRILDYRKQQGKFTDLAQLLNVPGIGPKTYEKLAPYIEL